MSGARSARLMKQISAELTRTLAAEGYLPSEALDDIPNEQPGRRYPAWRRLWFTAPQIEVPGLTSALLVRLRWDDGLSLAADVQMVSDTVAAVLREVSPGALTSVAEEMADRWQSSYLESVSFGYFYSRFDPSSQKIWIASESDIAPAVDRFMMMLRSWVYGWISERNSIDKLLDLGRQPSTMGVEQNNPDPTRLRGVVVLALHDGRAVDAAELMDWYLRRARFTTWDTIERAKAFDAAMCERFLDFAHARGHTDIRS
ncbi:hypothetical protein ACFXHA_04555 [Nocardia sp. NPDC059240]|uniref:hypothetical protein n=1 Tax=Nocardia sp. NPDC059240 TaxID=3346786 RepID=UPI00368F66D3